MAVLLVRAPAFGGFHTRVLQKAHNYNTLVVGLFRKKALAAAPVDYGFALSRRWCR